MAGYLSGNRIQLLVIGLVTITAIAGGAGVITDSIALEGGIASDDPRGGGGGPGGGNDTTTDGTGGVDPPDERTYDFQLSRCIDALDSIPGTAAFFGAFGLLIYGISRRYSFGAAMLTTFGLSPFVLTFYFLNTDCVALEDAGTGEGGDWTPPIGEQLIPVDVPPTVLLGLVGVLLVVAAAVAVRATGEQYEDLEEELDDGTEPDVTDLAEAAGAAADRLQKHNADVDNAVYRAWWEMTQLLDVPNPDSATPGDFADAAVEVGMGREHVDELTTLFEEVRYGRRDAGSREEHAISVFRTIESEYGGSVDAEFDADDGDGATGSHGADPSGSGEGDSSGPSESDTSGPGGDDDPGSSGGESR